MKDEIVTLKKMNAFEEVDWSEAKIKPISSVWAFKQKRYPDGSICKLKAQICARGFEQREGIDYFETYAPVVQ